jgi:hypothetical protein
MNSLLLAALLLTGASRTGEMAKLSMPEEDNVQTLANGEVWVTIHPNGAPVAFEFLKGMPTYAGFTTEIVENLPASETTEAPQSVQIEISGDCQSKTYTILGMLPYSGKMRTGLPRPALMTGPENVLKLVHPGSPMEQVFAVVCQ